MDAEFIDETIGVGYTDECILYRQVPQVFFTVDTGEIAASAFCPKRNPNGLSTDWNQYSSPEESLIRVGLTFKTNTSTYKDHQAFYLCKLIVGEVRKLQNVQSIMHSPILNEPEIIGTPNNESHTDVFYNDEELRIKLKGIAKPVEDLDRDYINEQVVLLRAESE